MDQRRSSAAQVPNEEGSVCSPGWPMVLSANFGAHPKILQIVVIFPMIEWPELGEVQYTSILSDTFCLLYRCGFPKIGLPLFIIHLWMVCFPLLLHYPAMGVPWGTPLRLGLLALFRDVRACPGAWTPRWAGRSTLLRTFGLAKFQGQVGFSTVSNFGKWSKFSNTPSTLLKYFFEILHDIRRVERMPSTGFGFAFHGCNPYESVWITVSCCDVSGMMVYG